MAAAEVFYHWWTSSASLKTVHECNHEDAEDDDIDVKQVVEHAVNAVLDFVSIFS